MSAATTTFAALSAGDKFKFTDLKLVFAGGDPDATFTKTGPFSFSAGKAKLTLDKVKTTTVLPLLNGFLS